MSDFRSRVLGTIIGTLSRGSFPKREPVAFLYNGVRLPGFPVVKGYDKAFIKTIIDGSGNIRRRRLHLFPDNASFTWDEESGVLYFGGTGVTAKTYEVSGNEWVLSGEPEDAKIEIPNSGGSPGGGTLVVYLDWANFDIEYNGTLYMKASKPVPVYE